MSRRAVIFGLLLALSTLPAIAQADRAADQDKLLTHALNISLLPYDGKPFHAILSIGPAAWTANGRSGKDYTGRVEVWWQDATHLRIAVTSPAFTLNRLVDGNAVTETHTGDFYPRWLETFVRALIDPVPTPLLTYAAGARRNGGAPLPGSTFGPQLTIDRDDRTNGISNPLTLARVGFDGPDQRVGFVRQVNYFISMGDWKPFEGKQIARTYKTYVLDTQPLQGKLTTLERLSPKDAAALHPAGPATSTPRLMTVFISTADEEAHLDHAPAIQWPAVHEGKTEGHMMLYARTDTTGQVREVSRFDSDNDELQSFGIDQAFQFKFKPYMVDGVPQQTEMPLVLHFTSRIENPTPVLDVNQMKLQTIACTPEAVPPDILAPGQHAIVEITLDETGKYMNSRPIGQAPWPKIYNQWLSVKNCSFRPFIVNGKPVPYKGQVELPVR